MMFWPKRKRLLPGPPEPTLCMYDSVTGLPTERLFLLLLTHTLAQAKQSQQIVAVFVVALEPCRPRPVGPGQQNATLVERVQGARIKGAVHPHHTVARLSADRFAVIVDGLDGVPGAVSIAQDIRQAMSLPLVVEGHELLLSCRIGVSVAPLDGMDSAALLDGATRALAKGQHDDAPINFLSDVTALTSAGQPGAGGESLRKHHGLNILASHR
ncbi:MAG: diguanylate cyclase [Nitrospiraceae bacterium]|nr:diguanylate cyclase [Nitrospiraceae bacterium]